MKNQILFLVVSVMTLAITSCSLPTQTTVDIINVKCEYPKEGFPIVKADCDTNSDGVADIFDIDIVDPVGKVNALMGKEKGVKICGVIYTYDDGSQNLERIYRKK